MVDVDSYESQARRWWNMVISRYFSTKDSARSYALGLGVDPEFINEVLTSKSTDKYFLAD